MPTANDTRVRVDGLSKITATARGPASAWSANGSALSGDRRAGSRAPAPRRSGRRHAGSGAGHAAGLRSRRAGRAGSAATKSSTCAAVSTSGGASRIASGWTGLTMNPARCGPVRHGGGHVGGEHDGAVQAARRAPRRRAGGRSRARRRRGARRARSRVVEQALLLDRVEHREAGGAGQRVAAERRAVLAGREQARDVGTERHQRADRHAAAQALGQRHGVGHDPGLLEREPACRCGRCRSAPRRARAARRGRWSARGPAAGRPGPASITPASPWIGSRTTAATSPVTAARRAASSPYGTCVTSGQQRLERLAVGGLVGQREGTGGAAVEGALGGDDARCGRCGGPA